MSEPIEFKVTLDEPIQFNLATGPQGPAGEKGDKGDTGEKGEQGVQGVQGEKGDTGERGPQGLTGATGAKGDKGEKGAPGTTDYNQLENKPDLTIFYKKTEADERFVAKEEGKDLSSNDYTDTEKTKLAGIAGGAEKNLPVDTELSETSKNAVENKAITVAVNSKADQTEVDELSSDTEDLLNALTTTDRGSNLNLKHTVDSKIRGVKLLGGTNQAKYTGKNIITQTPAVDSLNGMSVSIADDGTITYQGTASVDYAYITKSFKEIEVQAGEKLTLSVNKPLPFNLFIGGSEAEGYSNLGVKLLAGQTSVTATATNTKKAICLITGFPSAGTVVKPISFKAQLERSETATNWEPYVGGQPSPNPDYPQEVKTVSGEQVVEVCGKNLLDINNNNHGYQTNVEKLENGLKITSTATTGPSFTQIKLQNPTAFLGKKLRLSFNKDNNFKGVSVYQTRGLYPEVWQCDLSTNDGFVTFPDKLAENMDGLAVLFYISTGQTSTITNIQLEKGNTATAYEPYQGITYPLNLGSLELCKLGDYQDCIFYDNGWKLEKKVGKITLTGDEAFEVSLGSDDDDQCYAVSSQFNNIIADTEVLPFCSHFKTVNFSIENDYDTDKSIMTIKRSPGFEESLKFMFSPNDTTKLNLFGANEFKAWLKAQKNAGKPVTITFVKANPEITEITDQNLITQLDTLHKAKTHKGITNILPSCEIEVDTLVSAGWLRNK